MDALTPLMLVVGGVLVGIAVTEYSMWRAQRKINKAISRALEHLVEELEKNGKVREKIHALVDDAVEYLIARIERAREIGLESLVHNVEAQSTRKKRVM